MGSYSGVQGNLQQCGDQTNPTCIGKMKGSDNAFNFDVLYINDDHTVATHYMCSEMMWGAFSFSWWNVVSKSPTLDTVSLAVAQNKVMEANVGYTDLSARMTDQSDTCEYDWTLADAA